jgi:hypothetical protein
MVRWAIEHLEVLTPERHRVRVHLECERCGVESANDLVYEGAAGIKGAFAIDTVEAALRLHPCPHTEEALMEVGS